VCCYVLPARLLPDLPDVVFEVLQDLNRSYVAENEVVMFDTERHFGNPQQLAIRSRRLEHRTQWTCEGLLGEVGLRICQIALHGQHF
jgi:hypothetical protein